MSKWVVCTVAHETHEFDTKTEALAFKDLAEGAFHMYKKDTDTRRESCEYIHLIRNDDYVIGWKGTCGNVIHLSRVSREKRPVIPPKYNFCPHCGGRLIVKEK